MKQGLVLRFSFIKNSSSLELLVKYISNQNATFQKDFIKSLFLQLQIINQQINIQMRPSSIRKTPNIIKKTAPYAEQERLILREQNDNPPIPVTSKGPKFNLSRNKRTQEQRTKNIYAALNDVGKTQQPPKETKEIPTLKHKFKFSSKANMKEGAIQEYQKKEEPIIGDFKRDNSYQKIPQIPKTNVQDSQNNITKLKLSLGKIKKITHKAEEQVDNQNSYRFETKQQSFERIQTFKSPRDQHSRQLKNNRPGQAQSQDFRLKMDAPMHPRLQYNLNIGDLESRQINLSQQVKPMNHAKQKKQLERVSKLNKLINLQMDMYEQMISLQSVTEYQLYISKIKSGAINNSQNQAFDEKAEKACQHAPSGIFDFGNQAPDDKSAVFIRGLQTQNNHHSSLQSFISKAAVVIEELIKHNKSFSMPPIYLLSLNPQLIGLYTCPIPISLYKCNDLSLALSGQKLYVARGQITCFLSIGSMLIGGTDEGTILIWSGQTQKSSFFDSVKSILGNSDFQLPSCSTDYIQRQSYFKGSSRIVSLNQKFGNQFYSLQQFGKIITWSIVVRSSEYKTQYSLQPLSYISLSSMYSDTDLLCRSMLKDSSQKPDQTGPDQQFKPRYFISCSKGIIKNIRQTAYPNYFSTDSQIIDMVVTTRGALIYTICRDNQLRIYNKSVSTILFEIMVPSSHPLQSILIPVLTLQEGIQLQVLHQIYISNMRGQVFHYNLLQNSNYPKQAIKMEMSQDKNLLKSIVSLHQNKLQFMFVTKELRTLHFQQDCKIDLTRSTQNWKRIGEEVKRFVEFINSYI